MFIRENHNLKWMIYRGTPHLWKPPSVSPWSSPPESHGQVHAHEHVIKVLSFPGNFGIGGGGLWDIDIMIIYDTILVIDSNFRMVYQNVCK